MRLNRMVDQRQRLRDLMSEVQENHTDIQRLWKAIEAGGIVWPVGIAAAPPIEEMSSSSSQSSSSDESSSSSHSAGHYCLGCYGLPDTLTLTFTAAIFNIHTGSIDIDYHTDCQWKSACSNSLFTDGSYGVFTLAADGKLVILTNTASDCVSGGVGGPAYLYPRAISCYPLHIILEQHASMPFTDVAEITE